MYIYMSPQKKYLLLPCILLSNLHFKHAAFFMKKHIVVKGNCCLQITICLEDFPLNKEQYFCNTTMEWKDAMNPFLHNLVLKDSTSSI